ncbi:putative indole-3-pyruvate monooxygenase [Arachis hypogaea]|nr:putative indole-3-pyruvate monooxygenase [Arachis hypogaea]
MEETTVVIVGGGPSGLAISACLKQYSISHIVLEKEDCNVSLWRKHAYDRVNLHLAKEFCELPLMSYPPSYPTFPSKSCFLEYVDRYVERFEISPRYCRTVESATYDEGEQMWKIEAKAMVKEGDMEKVVDEVYRAKYVVIATEVLVVGCGNSGMEIAYDLQISGAKTSILMRNPVHVVSKELIHQGMRMLKYLPVNIVDSVITFVANIKFGDLSPFGIRRPNKGPFYLKEAAGRSPILDVGTIAKIKDGSIKVIPSHIMRIENNKVIFGNNTEKEFDAIMFATGYKSVANKWLKDNYKYVLNEDGMPKNAFPKHWKGEHGLYCAGLSRRGLFGVKFDAEAIADDINRNLHY